MKQFNWRVAAAIIGLMLSPSLAFGQAQPIGSTARLVPLNIKGFYVAPLIKPVPNPARYQLLIAAPVKAPLVVALFPSVCVADLRCP